VTYSTPGAAAPGWYPTTPGSSQVRWWDGAQWTEHYQTLGVAPGAPGTAPDGTRPNTVWIWIFVLLPLAQLAELPLLASLYTRILSVGLSDPTATTRIELSPSSGYLAIQGIGLALYGVYVVVGALDYRALKARGVPRPFHWAWTFLSPIVYIIGRSVVVRRRTGSGFAPMWIYFVVLIAVIVGALAVVLPIVNAAVSSAVQTAG
jgi:Protein of unknown function (DUF2510)